MGHSRWTLALCALAFLAAGILPMLDAFGYFPGSELRMNAPRWVIVIVAGLFVACGVHLFLLAAVGEAMARACGTVLGLAVFVGLAAVAHWVAFGAGDRSDCSGGFSSLDVGYESGMADTECRIAFGYGALLMDFIFLRGMAWWYAKRHPQSRYAGAFEKMTERGIGLMLLPLIALVIVSTKAREGTTKLVEKMRNKDAPDPPAGGSR